MRRSLRRVWISSICLLLCLTAAFGVLGVRGDWRYRLLVSLRQYSEPAWVTGAPEGALQPTGLAALLADPRVTKNDSLMLVNEAHPLREDWSPTLVQAERGSLYPSAAEAFADLQTYVYEQTGEWILIRSAYRSPEEQADELIAAGEALAARPGESEHETGLSLDACVSGYGGMSFLKTRAGRLTNDCCAQFGFVIRYPAGKSQVTGFDYEPWHLRYVGEPHAAAMAESGLTLEEYLSMLTPEQWFCINGAYVLRTSVKLPELPVEYDFCTVSEDGMGNLIYTFFMF